MHALRHTALSVFKNRVFHKCPKDYNVLIAKPKSPSAVDLVQLRATTTEIKSLEQTETHLVLVTVSYDALVSSHAFHTSVADCQSLFKTLCIDTYGFGLVANDMMGFHFLDEHQPGATSSYYLQCSAYKILWSYDRRRKCSRAVVFVITKKRGLPAFADLVTTMTLNLELLTHPLFLPLSAGIQSLNFIDTVLRNSYDTCGMIESSTGYRRADGPLEAEEVLREHKHMSRAMSVLIRMAEKSIRQIKQWRMAISAFETELLDINEPGIVPADTESLEGSRVSALAAIRLIRTKLDVMEIDFTYVRVRASNHAGALSQMIAQKDTLTSIELAMTATRDSSSMKVVAVVTMAFLPGTFFAAVFAIPSLDWGAKTVVQSNFWVFLAFTFPSTVLVFVLWGLLTQRDEIGQLYRNIHDTLFRKHK